MTSPAVKRRAPLHPGQPEVAVAVIDEGAGAKPSLSRLALACRNILGFNVGVQAAPQSLRQRPHKKSNTSTVLQAFCLSALALPGVFSTAVADDADGEDEVGYDFSHYEEGNRSIYTLGSTTTNVQLSGGRHPQSVSTTAYGSQQIPNNYQPITVDSESGFGRFRLTDRVRFAFNYGQDVWSGASPISTGFAAQAMNSPFQGVHGAVVGASPQLANFGTAMFFNAQGQAFYNSSITTQTGVTAPTKFVMSPTSQLQHTLGYASPEIRNSANFKLGYDFDNAAVDAGGGFSNEHDYQSTFGNLAGRFDFNQKRTTVNIGLSYTDSKTHAQELDYLQFGDYSPAMVNNSLTGAANSAGTVGRSFLNGNREDATVTLALSQIMTKNSVWSAGFNYTRSYGYMANPYKGVTMFELLPSANSGVDSWWSQYHLSSNPYPNLTPTVVSEIAERRPSLRNQFTLDTSYSHYIEPLNAAAKLSYSFFHDDWGINAHTFDGEWRQALGSNWMLVPNVRYYSQSAASFYAPYFFTNGDLVGGSINGNLSFLSNRSFSSDQRLSAYGTLSGGVTLTKQFARGFNLDVGFDYYTHKSALTLGGGGSGDFTDFHYFVANASLRANLGKLALVSSAYESGSITDAIADWASGLFEDKPEEEMDHSMHMGHHHHAAAPAGVMFSHMLDEGQFMFGYRLMHANQSDNLQYGNQSVNILTASQRHLGCYNTPTSKTPVGCAMYPNTMTMNMHMLDLMYAPTNWLTLMVMPQYMDMTMSMYNPTTTGMGNGMGGMADFRSWMSNGGLGDTGLYALFKLWDDGQHHIHFTQGLSAPTGSINVMSQETQKGAYLYPIDMQNGSGTWDWKPSLTYTGKLQEWFWGGQLSGTKRLQPHNYLNYALGDIFQGTAWAGYQFNNWLSTTVRGLYTEQGAVRISNPYMAGLPTSNTSLMMNMTDSWPQNYGGSFGDVGIGATLTFPKGKFAGNSISAEWLQPVYTNFIGYQLERTGTISATWSYHF
jgi:hypothetical protein